ncbi:MAG: hypothetical protein MJZ34_10515 [Paludibacteraceae bacterium]|nr:hypothetical protein [Paludibacteraceae bacterium]
MEIDNYSLDTERIKDLKFVFPTDKRNENHNVEGIKAFFNKFINDLLNQMFHRIIFKDLKSIGTGGFYTEMKYVNIVCFDKSLFDIKTNTITFPDWGEVAITIHEMCHFYHLCVSGGMFTASRSIDKPEMKSLKTYQSNNQVKFDVEYEAYHLSKVNNRIYKMGMEKEIERENKNNLLNVLLINGLVAGRPELTMDSLKDVTTKKELKKIVKATQSELKKFQNFFYKSKGKDKGHIRDEILNGLTIDEIIYDGEPIDLMGLVIDKGIKE